MPATVLDTTYIRADCRLDNDFLNYRLVYVYCTRICMCVCMYQAAYYLLQGSQKSLAKPSMHERRSIEKVDAAVFSCTWLCLLMI
jgi:hypothetical protein